jgi:uncharacterized metal-binding protein
MVDLPKKKVGIIACSGEERVEGTITRQAALRVLEQMRPDDTVTICLPLFLAGGAGDRAFARFHPTIAVDGCDKRCAARATEHYSGKPAASVVVTDLVTPDAGLGSARRLSDAGRQAAKTVAEEIAHLVDTQLAGRGAPASSAAAAETLEAAPETGSGAAVEATCSCGSGIPVLDLAVNGHRETLIAVPAIFEQLHQQGKRPDMPQVGAQLLEMVRIYNPIPEEATSDYETALLREFEVYCQKNGMYCENKEA